MTCGRIAELLSYQFHNTLYIYTRFEKIPSDEVVEYMGTA